jgi:hypothetical protein
MMHTDPDAHHLATQLQLSEERRAVLAPKLARLMADLGKLQALEEPDVEPVSTEWLMRSFLNGR